MDLSILKRNRWLLPCVLAIIAYSNSLNNGWHFDDRHSILYNKSIRTLDNSLRFFTDAGTFSGKDVRKVVYRPLLLLGYALTYAAGGYYLPLWHSVQIILHCICVYLIYCFILRLTKDENITFWATTFYAVHPIHTHAVNYLCSRSEIQASIFMVATLLAAMRSCEGEKKRFWQIISYLCMTAALLTKAIAVTTPFIFMLWDLWLGPASKEEKGLKKAIWRALPLVALVCGYMIIRKLLLEALVLPIAEDATKPGLRLVMDHPVETARSAIGGRSIFTNLLAQATVLWTYIYLLFWPPALTPIHNISPSPTFLSWPTVITVPAVWIVLGLLFYWRKKFPLHSFCGLFFFFCVAPTTLLPLNLLANEHRVYLGSAGLFLILSRLFLHLTVKVKWRATIGTVLVVVLILSTLHRNTFWRSSAALWADARAKAPTARYVHHQYAVALLKAGFTEEALWQMEMSFKLYPFKEPIQWIVVGANHATLGNVLLAKTYVEAGLKELPEDKKALMSWAIVLVAAKRPFAAIRQLRSIRKKYPNLEAAKVYLEQVEQKAKATALQIKQLNKALAKNPTVPGLINLSTLLLELGEQEKALLMINKALAADPKNNRAQLVKGEIYLHGERFLPAIEPLQKAATEYPKLALGKLAIALGAEDRIDEARAAAKKMLEQGWDISLETRYFAKLPPYDKGPAGWQEIND